MRNEKNNKMITTTNIHTIPTPYDATICIDEIVEHDADGNPAVIKNICYIVKPSSDSIVFHTSPYQSPLEILNLAKAWVELGCPENKDELGLPQEWHWENMTEAHIEKTNNKREQY